MREGGKKQNKTITVLLRVREKGEVIEKFTSMPKTTIEVERRKDNNAIGNNKPELNITRIKTTIKQAGI